MGLITDEGRKSESCQGGRWIHYKWGDCPRKGAKISRDGCHPRLTGLMV